MKLDEVLKSEGLTCALPYAAVGDMMLSISDSAADEKERAISFCGNGNELSFPRVIGRPLGVVPICPVDKKHIGDFHTHTGAGAVEHWPEPEKCIRDWNDDFHRRNRVSCVGIPDLKFVEEGPILENTIVCHTFKTEHPEYESFRKRLLAVSNGAVMLERSLAKKTTPITDEERANYELFQRTINTFIEEGKSKGIISDCAPYSKAETFSVPDLEGMFAEQREEKK